jgi:hypothetical protein
MPLSWRYPVALLSCFCCFLGFSQEPPRIVQLASAQLWKRLEFRIDNLPLAAVVYPPPVLKVLGLVTNSIELQLGSETGGHYTIQRSENLVTWSNWSTVTNSAGILTWTEPLPVGTTSLFLRARKSN